MTSVPEAAAEHDALNPHETTSINIINNFNIINTSDRVSGTLNIHLERSYLTTEYSTSTIEVYVIRQQSIK